MDPVKIELLGGYQVFVRGEQIIQFHSAKALALFAYLSVESDRAHERMALATLLWSEWPDDVALRNLRKTLHRLKQLLDQFGVDISGQLLTVSRQIIRLNSNYVSSDVTQFNELIDGVKAHKHTSTHSCVDCVNKLEQAASMYHGDFLNGFNLSSAPAFEEWVAIQREILSNNALWAFYQLAEASKEVRDFEKMQQYASRQIHMDAYREDAIYQLMTALASSGQQGEAIAQYEAFIRLLKKDLQVKPQEKTRSLYDKILKGEFDEVPDLSYAISSMDLSSGPEARIPTTLNHFPVYFLPLINRELEKNKIIECLQDNSSSLLTVVGPAGIGKTHLLVVAVKKFIEFTALDKVNPDKSYYYPKDGAFFVPIPNDSKAEDMPALLAKALDLNYLGEDDVIGTVIQYLKNKQCLIVLDNFEHLTGDTQFISDILAESAGVHILVSSIHPVYIHTERLINLFGLDWGNQGSDIEFAQHFPAVQMFVQSANYFHPGFSLNDENVDDIIRICRLVQGVPLAIEIAASFINMYSCNHIAAEILHDPSFLTTEFLDFPLRHRSIEAVFNHSWNLLSSSEKVAFARLSIFPEAFDLEAASSVAQVSPKSIQKLLDSSFLYRQERDTYEVWSLMRPFAFQKLEDTGLAGSEPSNLKRTYINYYLNYLGGLSHEMLRPDPDHVIDLIQHWLHHIHYAWKWALEENEYEVISRSLDCLGYFYEYVGQFDNGLSIMNETLNSPTFQDNLSISTTLLIDILIQLLVWKAHFLYQLGDNEESIKTAQKALSLSLQYGLEKNRARSEAQLSQSLLNKGLFYNASFYLRVAIEQFQALDDQHELAHAYEQMSLLLEWLGKYDQAEIYLQKALSLSMKQDDRTYTAQILSKIAGIYIELGDLEAAQNYLQDAAAYYKALDHPIGKTFYWLYSAAALTEKGNYDMALSINQQALNLVGDLSYKYSLAELLGQRGKIFFESGDLDAALSYFFKALIVEKESGRQLNIGSLMIHIGEIYLLKGDLKNAMMYCEKGCTLVQVLDPSVILGKGYLLMGDIFLQRGDLSEALDIVEKGLMIANEINSYPLVLRGGILSSIILFEQGDSNLARIFLEDLLRTVERDGDLAKVYVALWKISSDDNYRKLAINCFQTAFTERPKYDYRISLEKLELAERGS